MIFGLGMICTIAGMWQVLIWENGMEMIGLLCFAMGMALMMLSVRAER